MKTIGILDGMSAASTQTDYKQLCDGIEHVGNRSCAGPSEVGLEL